MVADCKSAGLTPYVGSNPTPTIRRTGGQTVGQSAKEARRRADEWTCCPVRLTASPPVRPAGVAQLVEHQPSKLRVAGSSPVARFVARVAQLVERILGKDEVRGSIPRASLLKTVGSLGVRSQELVLSTARTPALPTPDSRL